MNPGLTEEVGKTVRGIVHVLESQPLALAMIISNFLLLGFVWYATVENNRQRAKLGEAVFHAESETRQLLARCVVPERKP